MKEVSEPKVQYMKNPYKGGIRIYKSFQEAEHGELYLSQKKSASEGLKETVELIAAVYGCTKPELDAIPMNREITIVRNEKYKE